jgi:hypothetical protein
MTISLSPRTGESGILQDGVEVVTINATGITAGIPAATTAEIQALTITNKFVNPANAGAVALGVEQTWQVVSRTINTTYYNTTGKPIMLAIASGCAGTGAGSLTVTINGLACGIGGQVNSSGGTGGGGTVVVPSSASYVISVSGSGSPNVNSVRELR